jgi:two-component system, sensor histidine kinase and response regulator
MRTYSILVVDDEPNNFEVIEALLPHETYSLHYASSGASAIAALDACEPDVILLDVMMPGMDGFEVCKSIKSIPKWQSTPIIMVTALSSKSDLARCLAEGADEFISKPVDTLELRARVHSMLRIKKQFDRIESLCKLQRNNIKSLETDLNELGSDLARGFANELNLPVKSILDDLGDALPHLHNFGQEQISRLFTRTYHSASELERLISEFWLYLEFSLASKQFKLDQTCMSKEVIAQSLAVSSSSARANHQIEDVCLAVSPHHYQWIVHKLLNNDFNGPESDTRVTVSGEVIDRMFHLSIDSRQSPGEDEDATDNDRDEEELGLGLKIVKKTVEMYDGVFLKSSLDRHQTTVYITLPIV